MLSNHLHRVLLVFSLIMPSTLKAQSEFNSGQIEKVSKTLKKGQKKLKRGKNPSQQMRKKNLFEVVKEAAITQIFPSWPVPKFSMGFEPVAGLEIFSKSGASDTERTAAEFGLYGKLNGIPFDPNNPGVVGSFGAGGAWGAFGNSEENGKEIEASGYARYWGQIGLTFLYKSFKNTLYLKRGYMEYSSDQATVSSNGISNDIGVLFYSWISGHYTLELDRVFASSQEDPILTETDHWLHARFFTDYLNAYFDLGPGYSDSEQKIGATLYKQSTTYFLAIAGLNPFWKFIATARAKYVFDASENLNMQGIRSPEEGLNIPVDKGLPGDSMVVTGFVGFENIFAGFGVGYQVNLTMLNMNNKSKKTITRQQGLTMAYSAQY